MEGGSNAESEGISRELNNVSVAAGIAGNLREECLGHSENT